ncbi:MAG: GIY-YIG nuclease family protein [Roseiflexaceae bacterium]|nr:GIY-YIG nuclease family protein [Roseiflexaceae bacterium]
MSITISVNYYHSKKQYPCRIDYHDDRELLKTVDTVVYGLSDPRTSEIYVVGLTQDFGQRLKQHCRVDTERSSPQDRRKIEIFEGGLYTQVVVFHVTDQKEAAVRWKTEKEKQYRTTLLSNRRLNSPLHRIWR